MLLAVTAQAQIIGGYPGYPLLPATTSVQWLGQPVPSFFNTHVYPYSAVNRVVVGNAVAPWFYYNPYRMEVQTSAVVKDATLASGPARTKRQIQLRYRGSSRRGRSLNIMNVVKTADDNVETAPVRAKRQIQLRYRGGGRNGRSLNEIKPVYPAYSQFDTTALARTQRQIQLRYRNSASRRRHGRSLNEPFTTA